MITAIGGRSENESWWALLLAGLAGIGIGVLTFYNPAITALTLQVLIAMWAVSTGLLQVVAAIRLRKEIQGELWLVAAGLLSIAFGVLLVARPVVGALAVLWIIGSYAVLFGIVLIALASRRAALQSAWAGAQDQRSHGLARYRLSSVAGARPWRRLLQVL